MNLDFKDPDRHLAFKLLIIIILFGIVNIVFIVNYLNLPSLSYLESQHIYRNSADINLVNNDPDFFTIDLFDGVITGIENIIIFIPMLWGFMKLIDLMYFLEKYKKD